jgi:hypothetical protein
MCSTLGRPRDLRSHSTKLPQSISSLAQDRDAQMHWLPILFRVVAVALGSLHAWAAVTSHSMNADGISYLDIGDAYMRSDWQTAINSVWSPMYSWVLGLVMHLLDPPMRWEFPVVHLVNFAVYLGALVCFGFFWRQLTRYRRARTVETSGDSWVTFPEWAWIGLGYTLFVWSSLSLIEIWSVTPDMLMAAIVYLAAGLILRIRLRNTSWHTFGLLGMVLGLGYLTKAVMFPLACVFLAVSLFSASDVRRAMPRVLAALLVFLLISTPFIAAISMTKGRVTFGGAGKLTYVRYVNGVPYPHWQGEPPGSGVPEHPSRRIFEAPPSYEFGTPIGGTYPISYDPSYWYEGVVARFNLGQQISCLMSSILFYLDLFVRQQGVLLVGVFILYMMKPRRQLPLTDIFRRWGLIIPALAAFGVYALVYVEGRYIGVFVVLFWADLLANVRLPDSRTSRRLASLLGTVMVLFMLMNIVVFNLEGYRDLTGKGNLNLSSNQQVVPPSWPGEIAEALHGLGIQPGDKVAVIGYGFDSFWARLARVQIVAEMLGWQADDFWLGDATVQSKAVQAFASTGAKAIIAESVPSYASLVGWHRVGESNHYILTLSQ